MCKGLCVLLHWFVCVHVWLTKYLCKKSAYCSLLHPLYIMSPDVYLSRTENAIPLVAIHAIVSQVSQGAFETLDAYIAIILLKA